MPFNRPTFHGDFPLIPFFVRRWFLIALLAAVATGLLLHVSPLAQSLADWRAFRNVIVATVLFLMALPLEASAMWKSIRRPLAPGLASLINLGAIPPIAWLASQLLSPSLAAGLIVAGATPCTLASASVWTRRAGGNDAVSILVTIATNLACFLVTPLWVFLLLGEDTAAGAIEIWPMVVKLATIVVAPLVAAQLIRLHRPLALWATGCRLQLGILAQIGLLSMVLLGAVQTGMRLFGSGVQAFAAYELVVMAIAVMVVHLVAFWLGLRAAAFVGLNRADRIAVGFAGSQKTLMVGLQVSMDLGVSILPMVTYHVGQLIADTFIADSFQSGDSEEVALQK